MDIKYDKSELRSRAESIINGRGINTLIRVWNKENTTNPDIAYTIDTSDNLYRKDQTG